MSLQTSTTVGFNESSSGRRLVLETDSSVSLTKIKGTSYVRVFPSSAKAKLTAVMGVIGSLVKNMPEEVIDYVSFNGGVSASLKYPTTACVIEMSKFLKATPVVVYHEESNSLIIDQPAYGIVKVRYTAYFDRYIVTHGNSPCIEAYTQRVSTPLTPVVAKAQPTYDPAFIVAEATDWEMASMEVSGPACEQNNSGYIEPIQFSDYEALGIKLEVDAGMPVSLYPYYFSADTVPLGFTLRPQNVEINGQSIKLYCGCRIRVYPRVPVTLSGVNCAVGSSIVGTGTKPLREAVTFNGSFSNNVQYPPSGAVTVQGTSVNAVSIFGDTVEVAFKKPGDWVNEVKWQDRNTYDTVQSSRSVRPEEIVVVTSSGNNTIPCYTFCEAQYSSDYYLYDVLLTWDFQLHWYAPAMVLATDGNGKIGYLPLDPPAKGGVL